MLFRSRKENYEHYKKNLSIIKGIELIEDKKGAKKNYAYLPIRVCKEYGTDRDELHKALEKKGVMARKYFYPITADQACFKNKYKNVDLKIARKMSNEVMILPLYEELSRDQIDNIITVIKETQMVGSDV